MSDETTIDPVVTPTETPATETPATPEVTPGTETPTAV